MNYTFLLYSICIYWQHFHKHLYFNFSNFPLGEQYNWMGLNALVRLEAILPEQPPSSFESDAVRERRWRRDKYSAALQVETIVTWLNFNIFHVSVQAQLYHARGMGISTSLRTVSSSSFFTLSLFSTACQKDRKDASPRSKLQFRPWIAVLKTKDYPTRDNIHSAWKHQ